MTIDAAIKEIKENMLCDYCISGCDKCDISSCSNKDAFNMAIQALERKKPKKITEIHIDEYICPSCGEENSGCDDRNITDKYCPNCGQRLEV